MSASRPAPPACYASWLDYVIDPCLVPMVGEVVHARAELAELRKELEHAKHIKSVACQNLETWQQGYDQLVDKYSAQTKELADTKAQLALQSANTVEAMQQRDAAQAERDALRMTRARGCQCGDADVCAVIHEMSIERDSLRAQVAELRGAILGLGELEGPDAWLSDRGDCIIRMQPSKRDDWNALVARLRAEAPAQQEKKQ